MTFADEQLRGWAEEIVTLGLPDTDFRQERRDLARYALALEAKLKAEETNLNRANDDLEKARAALEAERDAANDRANHYQRQRDELQRSRDRESGGDGEVPAPTESPAFSQDELREWAADEPFGFRHLCGKHVPELRDLARYALALEAENDALKAERDDAFKDLAAVGKELVRLKAEFNKWIDQPSEDRWREAVNEAAMERLKTAIVEAERDALRAALEEIVNPIKFMRARLKPDEVLNGMMAVQLAESASYLQEIAHRALKDGGK